MSRKLFDGVIESVRYAPDGQIEFVCAYERRGTAFSDRILLTRDELMQRLKEKKKFVVGTRKVYMGGMFETGKAVKRLAYHNKEFITTDGQNERDFLEDIPLC